VSARPLRRRVARVTSRAWRLATASRRVLPDYVIIGTNRCGTTSLHAYLRAHPSVLGSRRKEVRYFDLHYRRGRGWYRSWFPTEKRAREVERSTGRVVIGEASPEYLSHPEAPGRLSRDLPEARLIALFRNPVDRALSHWRFRHRKGTDPLPAEKAMEAAFAIEEGREVPRSDSEREREWYLSWGRYAQHLEAWLERIPSERLLLLRSEDLYADPVRILHRAQDFLDLPGHTPEAFPARSPTSPEPVDPALRERLSHYYRPWNRKLETLLGWNLDWDRPEK
jgi:hypothetical protein